MTTEQVRDLLNEFMGIFPQFGIDENRSDVWCKHLEPVPVELVSAVVQRLLDAGPAFPPNVAQIVAEAKKLYRAANPDPAKPEPGPMWGKILTMVRDFPPNRDGEFLDKYPTAARALAAIGGFPAMRTGTSEDIHRNLQPRFIRLYAAELEHADERQAAEPLKEIMGNPIDLPAIMEAKP